METQHAMCPACEGAMDVTDLGPFTRVSCPQCGEEVRVKTEMGPYQLRSRLAEGGMSVLFVALDKTLGREVAVKVLNDDYSGVSSRVAQFEQEAKLTASVTHPNVVRVYTVGKSYDRCFIAMELVSGKSLEVIMEDRGTLPQTEVMPMALQVVEGLRAAHLAGLIHRDVKPGNILIDDAGTVKIVDFGLSLLTDEMEASSNEIWATPYYVPPEALTHEEEDFRSDVYALGASLYHALSGQPPVEGLRPSTRALQEEKKNIKPLGVVASWLHPRVIALVERAMAHRPADRFSSYEEFRDELKKVCQVLAGNEEPGSVLASEREQRRKSVVKTSLLASFLIAGLLAGGAYFFWKGAGGGSGSEGEDSSLGLADSSLLPMALQLGTSPEDAERVSVSLKQAREALKRRDYILAQRAFESVAVDEGAPQATRMWARFEAVVSSYLKGRPGDGFAHLGELQELLGSEEISETAMGRRLRVPVSILNGLVYVPEEAVPKELSDPIRATVFFAYCLKMWEQGQLDRARDHFEELREAGAWVDEDWGQVYQEVAEAYLDDHKSLSLVGADLEGVPLEAKSEELAELYSALKTRGRARFMVREWQTRLRLKKKNEKEVAVEPSWESVRSQFLTQWRAGDFVAAKSVLLGYRCFREESIQQKAMMLAVLDRAEQLIRSLMTLQDEIVLEQALKVRGDDGDGYKKVLDIGPSGLLVSDLKGEKETKIFWAEVELASLLALHVQRLHEVHDAEERKGGLNRAVAFALLGGLSEQGGWLFARVEDDPAPGGYGTWKELRAKLGL